MWHLRSIRLGFVMLAAGLLHGVCRAASWFPLGPFGGDVRSLAADPADPSRHLFLGTATGWVYDSHDGGASWDRVSQITNRNDLAVDHILVDKTNPKRLVVGAWVVGKSNDGGIFISEDYGKNWYSQAEMRGQSVRSLARSDSNPEELVAGTLKGVYRSMDNGVHWQQISPADSTEIHEVESVAIDPVDPNVIYAGTWHLPWKTTDGGASWHSIKTGLIDDSDVFSIIVDPKQPEVVYASACSGIYKSTDGGDLFHKVQGIPSAARRTRKLTEDPEQLDTVFAGTTEGLYRTLDAGAQWERMTPADFIVNDVYVDPNDSQHVVIATDRGGVYRSGDGGTTFDPSNAGFSARQVTAYAQDAHDPNTIYVGLVNDKSTGGVFESTDGAVHWQQQSEGLGGRDVFSLLTLSDGTLLAGTAHGFFHLADGTWTDSSLTDANSPAPPVRTKAQAVVPARVAASRPAGVPVHAGRVRTSPTIGKRRGLPAAPTRVAGRASASRARPGKLATHAGGGRRRSPVRVLAVNARGTSKMAGRNGPARSTAAPHPADTARAGAGPLQAAAGAQQAKQEHASAAGHVSATVYSLASADSVIFAGTGSGLLRSGDEGQHWTPVASLTLADVHFLAATAAPEQTAGNPAASTTLLAAGLVSASMSVDGGETWVTVPLPAGLTEIGAVGLDGDKDLWIGGREGVWFSTDHGTTWKTLRNLFLTQVDSLYYDAAGRRMLVTAANSAAAFSVQLPDDKVTYWNTGWRLRFVRPVGDHLVAATLFDGMVVQPEMVATPVTSPETGTK